MRNRYILTLAGITFISEAAIAGGTIEKQVQTDLTVPVVKIVKDKYEKKPITIDDGSVHGYVRMHHVFDGDNNNFDPVTGSGLGFGLGYGLQVAPGMKIGGEVYGVIDSGLTDTDESAIAYGIFMNDVANELDAGGAWGIHMRYETDNFKATLARSEFESPMTKIMITLVPNLYEYARVDGKVLGGDASLSYITKMSYGSRACADFGLIGENTGTAGVKIVPLFNPSGYLKRGTYYDIEETVSGNDSNGILVLGYEKNINAFNFKLWDFMIDDIANNLYAEGTYKFPLENGKMLKFSGQVWNQTIDQNSLDATYGGTMLGAEALLKWGSIVGKFAYTSKDDGGLLNAWGSDPGYTSSIFSRNEYRSNVDAYKATLVYSPLKNLKFMISYANYGQSDMSSAGKLPDGTPFILYPNTDASERDMVITYKPRKDITLTLLNANRVSEFDSAYDSNIDKTFSRTQNHTRLIMNFAF